VPGLKPRKMLLIARLSNFVLPLSIVEAKAKQPKIRKFVKSGGLP